MTKTLVSMHQVKALWVLALVLVLPPTGHTQSVPGQVVSSRAHLLADAGGVDGPLRDVLDRSVSEVGFGGSIRFESPDVWTYLPALEAAGVIFDQPGKPICVGRVCSAFVPFDALEMLEFAPGVERVEPAWVPSFEPLMDTIEPLGAYDVQTMGPVRGLTGAGVTIGDLDRPIDFYHPSFFNADGGTFEWFDQNENGEFDLGEPIDYDRDGEPSESEITSLLEGTQHWEGALVSRWRNRDNGFTLGEDWVYLDLNQNGHRDYGTEAGFSDTDPAFGEPIFVADNLNRNQRLDAGERFIALGSSKLSAVVWGNAQYYRGEDLTTADNANLGDLDRSHGTSVAGILAGGQGGRLDEIGIAPGSDLVSLINMATPDGDQRILAMAAAQDLGIDIVIHEYGAWTWVAMDGSGNLEAAMDAARGMGQLQVNPAGNLADSGKHTSVTISSEPVDILFDVDDGFYGDLEVVYLSLHWPATDEEVHIEITVPGDDPVEFGAGGWLAATDNASLWSRTDRTARGMDMRDVLISPPSGEDVVTYGRYRLRVWTEASPRTLHAFLADPLSGWGRAE
ncbi:MAG: S8 family serine peptidase, partial [Myxococcales bacterium]|nr:S8 family serine peptidase [Myxococcales bacterium]